MGEEDYTNEHALKAAFDFFDEVFFRVNNYVKKNHNGQISVEEIKHVFAEARGDEAVQKILKEADTNHDGEVF